MKYSEQLQHPKWKIKRQEVLARDGYRCFDCHTTDNLHVHHTHYFKGAKAWEYEHIWLVTLCADCHSKLHETEIIPVEEDDNDEFRDNYKTPMSYNKFKWYLSFRLDQPFEVSPNRIHNWLDIPSDLAVEFFDKAVKDGFLVKVKPKDIFDSFYLIKSKLLKQ